MERQDREDEIEGLVGKWKFHRAGILQKGLDLRHRVLHAVPGNVDPRHFEAGHRLHQVVQEKCLTTADIQHFVASLEAVVRDHGVGDFTPAPIVFVTPIAGMTVAVPVIVIPFLRGSGFGLGIFGHAHDVIAFGRLVNRREKIDISHGCLVSTPGVLTAGRQPAAAHLTQSTTTLHGIRNATRRSPRSRVKCPDLLNRELNLGGGQVLMRRQRDD